jgi:putative aldouronate transport system substrate-binding protein
MNMKKLLAIIIGLTIAAGMLLTVSGCVGGNANYDPDNFLPQGVERNPYQIVKEPITLKIFVPRSSINPPFKDMISFKELSRITNLNFKFVEADSAAYASLRTVTWENKADLPDVFLFQNTLEEQMQFAPLGALVRWNDSALIAGGVNVGNLIENYMPTYKALLDSNFDAPGSAGDIDAKSVVTLDDGFMYSLVACSQPPRDMTFKMYLNQEWINYLNSSLGYKLKTQPGTMDEYLAVLRAFKAEDANRNGDYNDEVPLSAISMHHVRDFLLSAYGYATADIEIENDGTKFVYTPRTDAYREYLKTARVMYQEGLLDNSTFEMNSTQLAGKGYGNRLGSWADAAAYLTVGTELEDNYTSFGPLLSSYYSGPRIQDSIRSYFQPTGACIPTGTPYVREIARLLDILYTDYGVALMSVGIEGDNWSWDNEERSSWTFNVPSDFKGTQEQYRAKISPSVGTGCALFVKDDFDKLQNNPTLQKINSEVEKYIPYIKYTIPDDFKMSTEEYHTAATIKASLDPYVLMMETNFITGVNNPQSDSDWAAYLKTLENYNYKGLEASYNAALARK